MEFVISILQYIISAIIGAIIALFLNGWWNNRQKINKLRFEVYMKLMELHGYYFWLYSAEIRKEKFNPQIKNKAHEKSWEIADLLRKAEKIPQTQKILEALFLEKYKFENRYNLVAMILNELGDKINPKYNTIMRIISEDNTRYLYENTLKVEDK